MSQLVRLFYRREHAGNQEMEEITVSSLADIIAALDAAPAPERCLCCGAGITTLAGHLLAADFTPANGGDKFRREIRAERIAKLLNEAAR